MDSCSDPAAGEKRKRSQSPTQEDAVNRPRKESPSCSNGLTLLSSGLLETLVIFGDSYSVSMNSHDEDPEDSEIDSEMTWVDHLKALPSCRNASIHNFSLPGATAEDDLDDQMERFFTMFPPKKAPGSKPALDPTKSSYVFSLGINDCGRTDEDDLTEILEKILDAAHTLYIKAGAREFIFVDVPPIDRSPGGVEDETVLQDRVNSWNLQLNDRLSEFARETPQATVFCFSAHSFLTDILDNPQDHGFEENDTSDEGGNIWLDDLHVTSAVHEIMASQLLQGIRLEKFASHSD